MARINLLPWREERRAEQKKEFLLALGFSVLAGVLVILVIHTYMEGRIDNQNARNRFISQHITQVDAQIKEIQEIDKQREELKTRMELIQELQHSRPEVVHIFDELPRIIPDGVHLTSLKRTGNLLEIRGRAESNTRISAFLRRLTESPWFGDSPDLADFSADEKSPVPSINFYITVSVGSQSADKEGN
jgi:type IV pilus assembly protein PilN